MDVSVENTTSQNVLKTNIFNLKNPSTWMQEMKLEKDRDYVVPLIATLFYPSNEYPKQSSIDFTKNNIKSSNGGWNIGK